MRSSSILDTSRRSAPVVEAILAGYRRLRCDERRRTPAQNTDANSCVTGSALTPSLLQQNTQQQLQQQARGGAVRLLLAAAGTHCLLHRNHFSDVKATQHSWINEKYSSSNSVKLVSIK